MPIFNEVVPGDRVVTSGLDGIFPPGITLGWILEVGQDSQIDKTLTVNEAVDPTRLEEVLVLVRPPSGEVLRRLDPVLELDDAS